MSSVSDPLRVGLVGFGAAARVFHAPLLQAVPGLRLAAILQRTGDTAGRAWPGVPVVRSLDDLLAIDAISLVVIATPNSSHAGIARRCLEAGRHVVIDKPFAPSSSEAREIAALAATSGRVLSVFHNRRWDGDFLTVRHLLRDGACGRVVSFESHFDRYRPSPKPNAWRERAEPGAGLLFDLGSHLVDQALLLFGLPEAVTGDVRVERDGVAADDAFDVVLHYPRLRAVLRATMLACRPGARFVVRGTEATYVKHHLDPQEGRLASGEVPGERGWGEEPRDHWGTLTRVAAEGAVDAAVGTLPGDYRRYYENVRDAVQGKASLAVTPAQAIDVVRLIELALESSRERRTLDV